MLKEFLLLCFGLSLLIIIKGFIMDTTEKCRNCKHMTADFTNNNFSEGYCRRFPPVPFITKEKIISIYPKTTGDRSCGEFTIDKNIEMENEYNKKL